MTEHLLDVSARGGEVRLALPDGRLVLLSVYSHKKGRVRIVVNAHPGISVMRSELIGKEKKR